ncbi:MAG: GtrA family protein [Oscillospiraceae bacterium]|nr:GtrA family protein [Oscillospiraceae bacterium]
MFEKILQFFVRLLPEPLKKLYDKFEELIVYIYYGVLTTIVNTIVQFGVEFGLLERVSWSPRIENFLSTSIAWTAAVIFAFYVNKKYVFKSKTESTKQLIWELWTFLSARLLSGVMQVGIMQLGVPLYMKGEEKIFWIYFLFFFIQQVVVTLANYFLSKFIIFRKKKSPEPQKESEN